MRVRIIAFATAAGLATTAVGGTFTPLGETGGSYRFETCAKPEEPDLTIGPALKGRQYIAAHNAAVKRFNAHVSAVNDYLECVSAEAERDLRTYYNAVSATLDAEQTAAVARVNALREGLEASR